MMLVGVEEITSRSVGASETKRNSDERQLVLIRSAMRSKKTGSEVAAYW